ncbi:MAG: hypothetical protein EA382_07600 [Spirochaetaceae bacterium]|nr:MAG: hypothetical protein EA382_07600 [Spirochaetaceae bacterium]
MIDPNGSHRLTARTVAAAYSYAHAICGDPDLAAQATRTAIDQTGSSASRPHDHWVDLFDATRRAALSLRQDATGPRVDRAAPLVASLFGRHSAAPGTGDALPVDAAALTAAFASLPGADQEAIAAALFGGASDNHDQEDLARAIATLTARLTERTLPADDDIPGVYDA